MTQLQVIRNVRPLGGPAVDVMLEAGTISALLPTGTTTKDIPCLIDGEGQLLMPAFVESHVHFDKTLWNTPWRPNSAGRDCAYGIHATVLRSMARSLRRRG